MKLIPLTQGLFAKVDDADYDFLMQWKWYATYSKTSKTFYAEKNGEYVNGKRGKKVKMHRLILGLTDPKIEGDHINHDGIDNQRDNLRASTQQQNRFNKKCRVTSVSKFIGVSPRVYIGKRRKSTYWRSRVTMNGKTINLGVFDTEIEAAIAYDKRAKDLFGVFANLNFKENDYRIAV